ncbi:MAG: histidine kinase [Marmoricola sp.]
MTPRSAFPRSVAIAVVVWLVTSALSAALTFGPAGVYSGFDWLGARLLFVPALALGVLITARHRSTPVASALAWLAASVSAVELVESWGLSETTAHPWPAAHVVDAIASGAWVWNLVGLVALCQVFPDGLLPGRLWRRLPWALTVVAVLLNAALALDVGNYAAAGTGGVVLGSAPWTLPPVVRFVELVAVFGAFLVGLVICVACPVVRYRRGDDLTRRQLRWLVLGAGSVPVLLAAGWVALLAGAPTSASVVPFFLALTVLVPLAVTVAVVREDLFDIDQLLSSSVAVLLTSLVTAGTFAASVVGLAEVLHAATSAQVVGAVFVAALVLAPAYRVVHRFTGRLLDRDRFVIAAEIRSFVQAVRDGLAEPEAVEPVLQRVLGDPGLRVVLRQPGTPGDAWLALARDPQDHDQGVTVIPLRSGETEVGAVRLSRTSARRVRRAREAVSLARLPIEVSRLRLELRQAVDDVRSSRARLAQAAAEERRRLERDLHDGAQQQIVAVGMRVRSAQRLLESGTPAFGELDRAVESLEQVVADLRTLAHGVRPRRLDDGLPTALRSLAAESGLDVDLQVEDLHVSEVVANTLYYVVSESLVNTLKHAGVSTVQVSVVRRGDGVVADVADGGGGGACDGFGITSLRDRVSAVGGTFRLESPAGAGTRVHVEIDEGTAG